MTDNNNYILNFRKRFGWSQQKLADMSGISRSSIKNWENSGKAPKWMRLICAALAYNLPAYIDKDNNDN